jgi:ribulose-phosphate 3-epimerase
MTKLSRSVKIAPSILSADFSRLGDQVLEVERAGADLLHVDVMDGHFVPNLTIGPQIVHSLKKVTSLPLDVHLMVDNPDQVIPAFIDAGSDLITVHVEVCYHLHRTISFIKQQGVKAGAVLNPATPLSVLEYMLPELDLILLMSVNPGFGGQVFIPQVLEKLTKLRRIVEQQGLDVELEIDGGVKLDNAPQIAKAGADILVVGSAVFDHPHPGEVVKQLKLAVQEAV